MTEPISTAQYFPWDGGAIFLGTAGAIPAHAHQAIQLCLLFEGRIRLRTNDEEPWTDYGLALVPSRQRHAMDGSRVHFGATIFVEPETREGRVLAERYEADTIADVDRAPVEETLRVLRVAALERRGHAAIVEHARRVVQALTLHTEPRNASDERIVRAAARAPNSTCPRRSHASSPR